MYINRHISYTLDRLCKSFPVLLITGARQTGKSTLLKNTRGAAVYQTFDNYITQEAARQDPLGFIDELKTPAILDEIQYVPDIFRAIKIRVDKQQQAGAFYITGSQQFDLMKNVSDSLAGRIGILTLYGLSAREIDNIAFNEPFLPTEEYLKKRRETAVPIDADTLWERIWRGNMPKLYAEPYLKPHEYYYGYVSSYIERDVRSLAQVGDELAFMRFITSAAARTGQLINLSDIARDTGISMPTAKRWLSILNISGIIYLIQPYSRNITQRTVKTPKLYFTDTGLAAYLCKWTTPDTLRNGAMAGQIFETYVITEIIKSYQNAGIEPPVYFYRDTAKREIDLVIETDGELYPIEIKKTSSPSVKDARHFSVLQDSKNGCIVCLYEDAVRLGNTRVVPVWMI